MIDEVQKDEELNEPEEVSAEQAFAEAVGEEYKPPVELEDNQEEGGDEDPGEQNEEQASEEQQEVSAESEGVEEKPYGDLDPAIVARIRQEVAKDTEQQFSGRIRNLEGHIGGLKQKLDGMASHMKEAKETAQKAGGDAPSQQQINAAVGDGEKMAALREDFPEFAEALDELSANLKGKTPEEDANFLNEVNETRRAAAQATAELAEMREMRALDRAHPKWETVVSTDGYQNWLANQPYNIQNVANNSPHARDAIAILDMYEEQAKTSQPDLTAASRQKQDRLEKATAPTSGGNVTRQRHLTEEEAFLMGAGEG